MFNSSRMTSFLSSVKETMDTANTAVNAKLNEGLQAAMQNEKVKSATTYIQQSIPIPGVAKADSATGASDAPAAVATSEQTNRAALLDLDDGHVEVEDWSASSSSVVAATTTNISSTSTAMVASTAVVPTADSQHEPGSGTASSGTASGGSIHAANIIECGDCKTLITTNSLLDKFNPNKSYHHCRMCAKVFCLSCIGKSPLPVPFDLLHPTYQEQYVEVVGGNGSGMTAWFSKLAASTTSTIGGLGSKTAVAGGPEEGSSATTATGTVVETSSSTAVVVTPNVPAADGTNAGATSSSTTTTINKYKEDKQFVCNSLCLCHLQAVCMENFRNEMTDKFAANVTTYLAKPFAYKKHQHFFPIPSGIMEDDAYRRALRFAHIADAVGSYTGLSFYIKAAKYAYMGTELVNMIIGSELYPVLLPMLENLKMYGITGPTALLCIYYLGCQHTMRYKENHHTMRQSVLYHPHDVNGVLASDCPLHVLEYISRFISPAQWLYTAVLPAPHDNNDWSSWYLSNMIKHQGWSLLMNINDTTKLPDGKKCPAFAIVARTRRDPKNPKLILHKEAMLVIRGSQSTMDWSINFEEELMEMSFSYRPMTSPSNLQHVMGYAHKGIYNGAQGLLDGYGARVFLMLLFNSGYHLHVVGHSLGAGVAALVAAELRSSIVQSQERDRALNSVALSQHAANVTSQHLQESMHSKALEVHRISAVVFSCPAIVTENLAVAFVEDRLLINVVNGPDAIPRFSRYTMQALAKEMDGFKGQAEIWTLQDKKDITSYIKKMGKASDIHHSTSQERTRARYLKLFQKKNETGGVGSDDEDDSMSGHSNHSNLTAGSSVVPASSSSSNTGGISQFTAEAEKGMKHIEQTFRTMIRRGSTTTSSATTPASDAVVTESEPTTATPGGEDASNSALSGLASKNAALWSAMATFASTTAATVSSATTNVTAGNSKADPPPATSAATVVPAAAPALPPKPPKPLPVTPSAPSAPPLIDLTVSPSAPSAPLFDATPTAPPAVSWNSLSEPPASTTAPEVSNASTSGMAEDYIRTVTPGPIVHLYKESDGSMKAAVITHQHPTFQHIQLLLEQLLEDHAIKTYRQSLDSVLFHARRGSAVTPSDAHEVDHLFPMHVTSTEIMNTATDLSSMSAGGYLAEDHGEDDDDDEDPLHDVMLASKKEQNKEERSPMKLIANNNTSTTGTTEVMDLGSMKVEKALAPGYICAWTPCSICQLDVTWPYIMHSDASRGLVKNFCAACHKVVCNFCAPAGDELPGDGVNQKVSLSDYRMALPWQGIYTPQRVCIHCYFNSSFPGLDKQEHF